MAEQHHSFAYQGAMRTNPDPCPVQRKRLIRARMDMLFNAPFFAQIAMRLKLEEALDPKDIPTAGTDGRFLFYNKEFIEQHSEPELVFLMGHEVLHAVLFHTDPDRVFKRDPVLWNIAADYVINAMLIDEKVGKFIESGLYDAKYSNMSVEQVYADLQKEQQKKGGQAKIDQLASKVLDRHMAGGSASKNGDSSEDGGQFAVNSDASSITEAERDLARELKQAVIGAAEACKRQAGGVPAGIQRILDEWLESKIDWRTMLAVELNQLFRSEQTWGRPNKKLYSQGWFLPSNTDSEFVEVAVMIDASGSIRNEEIVAFCSEIRGIMDQYNSFKLYIWSYDTQVYGFKEFTQDNMSELPEYAATLKGGGGTSFECNYDFMREQDLHPKQIINFTDGFPNASWGEENYAEQTIFVIKNGGTKVDPPFGVVCYYDNL